MNFFREYFYFCVTFYVKVNSQQPCQLYMVMVKRQPATALVYNGSANFHLRERRLAYWCRRRGIGGSWVFCGLFWPNKFYFFY